MKTAQYWHREETGGVRCELCPHRCLVREGRTGLCRVRGVKDGNLVALGYGSISSAHLDPIEKKPLYHFHPGSAIFSVGGWGCNFGCLFCQNWSISQEVSDDGALTAPERLISLAGRGGSIGIAYTYNEPVIGFEYVLDCARLVRGAGLKNVLVTNGFINPEPAAELLPWVDAMNIDIKSMDDAFYREQCKGRLEPVLALARQAVSAGCHVEITNLVIPGTNDADRNFAELAEWVAGNLGPATPLHLSAYRPEYKSRIPRTPAETLLRAYGICKARLPYVYLGNVLTAHGQDSECPGCGAALVRREGFAAQVCGIRDGACSACGRAADFLL